MLQNAYFLAKIGADTAENEQHFAEILPTDALWRRREGSPAARRQSRSSDASATARSYGTAEEEEEVHGAARGDIWQ